MGMRIFFLGGALVSTLFLSSCHKSSDSNVGKKIPEPTGDINPEEYKNCQNLNGIVGGVCVSSGDPTISRVAGIVYKEDDGVAFCTASIVDDDIILTAAHCIPKDKSSMLVIFHENTIYNFLLILQDFKDQQKVAKESNDSKSTVNSKDFFNEMKYNPYYKNKYNFMRTIDKVNVHENYVNTINEDLDDSQEYIKNDLALVRLTYVIPSTHVVTEFLDDQSINQLKDSSEISYEALGYGVIKFQTNDNAEYSPGYLRKVEVQRTFSKIKRVKEKENSKNNDSNFKTEKLNFTSPLVVIEQFNKKGICAGDSGGALYMSANGQTYIAGVASFVERIDESGEFCHGYGNYMNAAFYYTWIQDNIKKLKN